MRISHFGAASFFGVVAIIELFLGVLCEFDGMFAANVFICLCATGNIAFAIIYGKYHIFTEKGIQHRFLGICYRRTNWDEVKDIMLVYQQTGERGSPKTLMFTTQDAPIYRPDASGYIKQKGFNRDWFCGKLFSVRFDDKKTADKILWYIEEYYGVLDYSFFAQAER